MRRNNRLCILVMVMLAAAWISADEGMWPLSEIQRLGLDGKGLEIPVSALYNPDGVSLIDGIVSLGGCSGSFVSADGLILTNHHCSFRFIQEASTPERNYLEDGFLAKTRDEEVQAKGGTVRITESYRDVSAAVLAVVTPEMDPAARAKAIEKRIKEIVAEAEKNNAGKRAEVAEMFIGKTYILFIYTNLKDVRLVYAPPRGIGEYGGEDDNWAWPRHTGDFSFLRAYTGPDGRPAEYSSANVPYRPKKYLQVAAQGVAEGDFVFILGYPGKTYRHQAASFLDYEYRIRMPQVVEWYGWQIGLMESASSKDSATALKLSSKIKTLSNTFKNNRGKITGIRRTGLLEKRKQEEGELARFIGEDTGRRQKYGEVLAGLQTVYAEMEAHAAREFVLQYANRSPDALKIACQLYEAAKERQKPDLDRESSYMERNWQQTQTSLRRSLSNVYVPVDQDILRNLLLRAHQLPAGHRIAALESITGNGPAAIGSYLEQAYSKTRIFDPDTVEKLLAASPAELEQLDDPFIQLAVAIYPEMQAQKQTDKRRQGDLNRLYGLYLDVKKEFLKGEFVPDANSTFRLSYGRIKGYQPADAIQYQPFTTLAGVVEKNTGKEPFNSPSGLLKLYRDRDYGRFVHPALQQVPVAMLYNTDTTGGNSGSPVLNARGELVGVNFDRVWEATINDYAWSPLYSRSVAVDIRYVLFVTLKLGGAGFLLQEMGVQP